MVSANFALVPLRPMALGAHWISAQRIDESRETIAVPDAQQDAIHRYVRAAPVRTNQPL